MTKTVYVVMKQPEDDWGAGPRGPHAVFTDKAEAEKYCLVANFAQKPPRQPQYQFWVDYNDDIQLDPETYKGIKYSG
jgi:hypothetical protein